jgi:nitrogen regulatory protein P-II 1
MKEIKAVLQPHMLNRVMAALHVLPHFPGATVSDCQGQGRGRGRDGHFIADDETIFFSKKCKLEIFCADAVCDEIVLTIQRAAHTGNRGDGVIMVADTPRVIRIRTGEDQEESV